MGNVISGNGFDGVQVFGPSAVGNVIQGNKIGTDLTGTLGLHNGNDGVVVNGAPGTQILGNVISANAMNGITITGPGTSGTLIQTNLIGQGVGGQQLGNGAYGILIVNGAPMPVGTGNTVLNNALGPDPRHGRGSGPLADRVPALRLEGPPCRGQESQDEAKGSDPSQGEAPCDAPREGQAPRDDPPEGQAPRDDPPQGRASPPRDDPPEGDLVPRQADAEASAPEQSESQEVIGF